MNDLVFIENDDVFTTSKIIAEKACISHHAVKQIIKKHEYVLEKHGRVEFKMQPIKTEGGVQNESIVKLNEQQSTLLITFLKNTDSVVEFKSNLVTQFYKLRSILLKSDREIKDTRNLYTYTLQQHGCNKPGHFIQMTKQPKEKLGMGNKSKKEMSLDEKLLIQAYENIAIYSMNHSIAMGYHEIKPVCLDSCDIVKQLINKNQEKIGA